MLSKTLRVILNAVKNLAKSLANSQRGILPPLRSVRMALSLKNGQQLYYCQNKKGRRLSSLSCCTRMCYTLSLFLLMKSPRILSRINVINMPMRINGSYFLLRSYTTFITASPIASASSGEPASEYTRMMGSVLLLRRCTHLSGKSIFTPSMSFTSSLA